MSENLFNIKGKVALVTGSSRGLGYTIAKGFGQAGAIVILNSRKEEHLKKATDEFIQQGIQTKGYVFDVTDEASLKKSISSIEQEVGSIDILINNAGIQKRTPLEDFQLSDWQEIIDTNLTGVFLTSREVVKGMIRRKKGKIINICSLMSEVGRATIGPYAAAKGGVKMLTRAMATEWAKYNVQVNGIGPGYFLTEMTKPLAEDAEFNTWICKRTPVGRWGKPEELVGTAIFLASSASNFINGQIIYVDGGILAAL